MKTMMIKSTREYSELRCLQALYRAIGHGA